MFDKILSSLKRKGVAGEVISVNGMETLIQFKANKLHSVERKQSSGIGLRVICDGKIGFASTTIMSGGEAEAREKLIENALESAKFGQEAMFDFPKKSLYSEVVVYDKNVEIFNVEKGINICKEIVEGIRSLVPEIKCDLGLMKNTGIIHIANTSGLNVKTRRTVFSYGVEGFIIQNGNFLWVFEAKSGRKLFLPSKKTVKKLVGRILSAKKIAKIRTGKMDVIFANEVMPDFLSALAIGVNGKNIQKKASPLTGRIGEEILDSRLSIYDNGKLNFALGSSPFDEEGVETGKTCLFEKGILLGYIFDLQTAGIMKTKSTGNGRRGYNSIPMPGMTNFFVKKGEKTLEEMTSGIKDGLLVYSVIGGGQSNLLAGDFSLNVGLGYKIEAGEITGRVKDTMVSGNVYELMKNNLLEFGSDQEAFGNFITPSFYFKDVSVVVK